MPRDVPVVPETWKRVCNVVFFLFLALLYLITLSPSLSSNVSLVLGPVVAACAGSACIALLKVYRDVSRAHGKATSALVDDWIRDDPSDDEMAAFQARLKRFDRDKMIVMAVFVIAILPNMFFAVLTILRVTIFSIIFPAGMAMMFRTGWWISSTGGLDSYVYWAKLKKSVAVAVSSGTFEDTFENRVKRSSEMVSKLAKRRRNAVVVATLSAIALVSAVISAAAILREPMMLILVGLTWLFPAMAYAMMTSLPATSKLMFDYETCNIQRVHRSISMVAD